VDPQYGKMNIIPGITVVVDTVTGRSARVEKILPSGVQVTVRQRGYELENWQWSWLTVRQPRLVKRYPRPFRFPREEKTECCHCKIGKMEAQLEKTKVEEGWIETWIVWCLRCKQPIGTESFPRRIERAYELVRKARNAKPKREVHKAVSRRARKVSRHHKSSVKARRKSTSKLGIRPTRSSNAQASNRKTVRKAKLKTSKVPARSRQKISTARHQEVSKTRQKGVKRVRHSASPEKVPTTDKVDIVASVPQPDTPADVRGSGSGGASNASEVLSGVPGGTDKVH